jgi:predicted lysophospholipase L1 biosynthesis ABC-type transport system permease subunit
VGVVGELYYPSLDRTLDCPQIYVPFGEPRTLAVLSLRCEAVCPDAARVHQRLAAADPRVEVLKVGALEDTYAAEVARPRATAVLAFAFSTTALVAAAAGLFSLLSATVNRRRRELGIRAALGASPADIRRLVVGEGVVVALTGIAIGVVAGLSLARLLTALQYGVTMTDPLSFVVVVVVLAATIAGASWRPARQAVQTDPALLLRDE